MSILLSSLQQCLDARLIRDNFFPQGRHEEFLILILPDLDLLRRIGIRSKCQEVAELFVVDLDVGRAQEELFVGMRTNVGEYVLYSLRDDTGVGGCSRLDRNLVRQAICISYVRLTYECECLSGCSLTCFKD